jgi:hypothetical protein
LPVALSALALAAAGSAALAQEVHKCVQGGEVTYQATPCPGADKVLHIEAGPDPEQVEAARERAAAQKTRGLRASPAASGAARAASGATVRGDVRP